MDERLKTYNDIRRAAFLDSTNPVSIDNLRRLWEASEEAEEKLRTSFFDLLKSSDFQRGMQLAMNKMGIGVLGL